MPLHPPHPTHIHTLTYTMQPRHKPLPMLQLPSRAAWGVRAKPPLPPTPPLCVRAQALTTVQLAAGAAGIGGRRGVAGHPPDALPHPAPPCRQLRPCRAPLPLPPPAVSRMWQAPSARPCRQPWPRRQPARVRGRAGLAGLADETGAGGGLGSGSGTRHCLPTPMCDGKW